MGLGVGIRIDGVERGGKRLNKKEYGIVVGGFRIRMDMIDFIIPQYLISSK